MDYVRPLKNRLTLVLDTLLFPFTFPEIFDAMRQREYQFPSMPGTIPIGQRTYVEGPIGMKNDCLVEISNTKKTIGIEGEAIENVVNTMKEIIQMSADDFKLMKRNMNYLELISDMLVISERSPIEAVENFGKNYELFKDILNVATASYSIKIVPRNVNPSNVNWFDILVEPRVTRPDREYFVHIIYRNEDFEDVMTFADNISSIVSSITKIIGDHLE